MIIIKNYNAVSQILKTLKEHNERIFILGKGANVLFLDEGFDGVIIKFANKYANIEVQDTKLICDSGVTIARMARTACNNSLTGAEFSWGIPGTVGGGTFMNAGAYLGEFSEIVKEVHYLDENFDLQVIQKKDLQFGYRHSYFTDKFGIIIKVIFELQKGDVTKIQGRMDQVMQMRLTKQPYTLPSAGSTFKRPEGAFAAALIQECGLKGTSVGGAQVSPKHSGFIVNNGGATAKDVFALIDLVKNKVKNDTGYELECEVKIVK